MNDGINQIGKYLGETQTRANQALDRVRAAVPNVERIRDIFDSAQSAQFNFKTKSSERIRMSLYFGSGLPLLSKNCAGCHCAHTESFKGILNSNTCRDDFDRVEHGSWGGEWVVWANAPTTSYPAWSVDGNYAHFNPTLSVGADGIMKIHPIATNQDFEFKTRFMIEDTAGIGDKNAEPQFYVGSQQQHDPSGEFFAEYHGLDLYFDSDNPGDTNYSIGYYSGSPTDGADDVSQIFTDLLPWGTWINVHAIIGTDGKVRANIWEDNGDPEPAGFMLHGGGNHDFNPYPMDTFYIFDPNVGQTLTFDYFSYNCPNQTSDSIYALDYTPVASSVVVKINGTSTTNYSISGKSITIFDDVADGDEILITYTYKIGNCGSDDGSGNNCTDCTCDDFSGRGNCAVNVGSTIGTTQISPVPVSSKFGRSWGPDWLNQGYFQDNYSGGQAWNTIAGVEQAGIGYLRINSGSIINSFATARTVANAGYPWAIGSAWAFSGSMRPTFTHSTHLSLAMGVSNFLSGGDDYSDHWVIDATTIYDSTTSGESPGTVVTNFPFGEMVSGSWYSFKWEYQPPASPPGGDYPSTGYTRIKIWEKNTTEPTDWLITSENQGGARVSTYNSNAIYLTLSSVGATTNNVQVDFTFCDVPGSANEQGWGPGDLGTWLPETSLVSELGNFDPAFSGAGYSYVQNGTGVLTYPIDPLDDPSFVNDPVQFLLSPAGRVFPINVYIESQTSGLTENADSSGFDWLIYFGPYYHNDWDAWLTIYPYVDTVFPTNAGTWGIQVLSGGNDNDAVPPSSIIVNNPIFSLVGDPINVEGIDHHEAGSFSDFVPFSQQKISIRALIDETGVYAKIWLTNSEAEPSGWQVNDPWAGAAPTPDSFRYMYLEDQSYGVLHPTSEVPPTLAFDKICITSGTPTVSNGGGGGGGGGSGSPGGGSSGGGSSGGGDSGGGGGSSGGGTGTDPGGDSSGGSGSSGGTGSPAGDLPPANQTFTGDATGVTDVFSDLQAFINALPTDGAVWGFGTPNGIYNIGNHGTLLVQGKTNLTVVGNGAQLKRSGTHNTTGIISFQNSCENVRIDTLKIKGTNPDPGTWVSAYENEHGIIVSGVRGFNANNLTIEDIGGDFVYFTTSDDRWSDNVRIHHSYLSGNGRMGIEFADGVRNCTIDFNTFENIGYHTWAVEPTGLTVESIPAGATNILIADNTIVSRPYGNYPTDTSQPLGYMFAVAGSGPATQITITRNTIVDGAMRTLILNSGGTRRDLIFTDNVSSTPFVIAGTINTVITVQNTTNVQITGNQQPMLSGTFENHSSCSGIINVTSPQNILSFNYRYISPTGSDSSGNGTLGNPWATIGKFALNAVAGDTLLCRGGTYNNTARIILQNGYPSGTASAPITVRNYPGETPSFVGAGSGSLSQFIMVTDGVAYWTFDGLTASGFKVGSSGVFYVGRNVGLAVPTHHIKIRNCTVTMVHEGGGPFNHCVYFSAYTEDCTIEYNRFIGASIGGSDGEACNIGDHEPSPQRTLIQRNVITNFGSAGGIWWNGDLNTGSILHNTFDQCTRFVSLRFYVSVTVRDNAGTHGTSADIDNVNDSGHGVATIDHNFFGQTFDTDYNLLPGNTGIGAASDGSNAGAK